MKTTTAFCCVVLLMAACSTALCAIPGVPPRQREQPPTDFKTAFERQLSSMEKNIVEAAEAMPEKQFEFTPANLHISGSVYDGVRTFAGQVKHLAADNFLIWSPLTGEALPKGLKNSSGPDELKSKTEIVQFLKDSFALGHRAVATVTAENAMEMIPFRGGKLPRLDLAFYALTHANDHYGQMVEYLRMAGIVPPASRPK